MQNNYFKMEVVRYNIFSESGGKLTLPGYAHSASGSVLIASFLTVITDYVEWNKKIQAPLRLLFHLKLLPGKFY